MIEYAAEKLDFFGTRPVVWAVIDDEHRLPLVAGQRIENPVKSSAYNQQKPAPIVGACLEQVICRILSDISVLVDNNASEEIFTDKR